MTRNHVVVGGGIAGLLSALLLAQGDRRARVHLIEREDEVGGLLRSFDYGAFGRFDHGMHNIHESGVRELDNLLFGLLPEADWQLLEGNQRDVAGLFFNGRLQYNSLYMDLRGLPRGDLDRCVAGFFANMEAGDGLDAESAQSYAETRFGSAIAELAVAPAVKKIFRRDAGEMGVMGAKLTSIDRVIMFDEQAMTELMKSDLLRARLAFPEQRRLPVQRAHGLKGYYPRRFGMHRVVDALRDQLLATGVRILTGAQIQRLEAVNGKISAIGITRAGATETLTDLGDLYWSAGWPALAPLLQVPMPGVGFDRPLRTVVVNFLLDRDSLMHDLHYLYCYEPGFDTFRVTNFLGYCENARREGGTPMCVELLVDPGDDRTTQAYQDQAENELRHMGVLATSTRMLFRRAEPLGYGFPMPTRKNLAALLGMRDMVRSLGLGNLVVLGILAEPGLFFQKDVTVHAFEQVRSRLQGTT